jgi:hypothetical protein
MVTVALAVKGPFPPLELDAEAATVATLLNVAAVCPAVAVTVKMTSTLGRTVI